MTSCIIYTNQNGNVSVCIPTGELPIEEVLTKDIPQNTQAYIVNMADLPNNANDFFEAWEQSEGNVTVNLDKAKQITKARLRLERKPLLEALDIEFQKALEVQQNTNNIVAEKNRLRDITNLVDACTTLDELRAIKVQS